MELVELRQARQNLEFDIAESICKLMQNFKDNTGCYIDGVELEFATCNIDILEEFPTILTDVKVKIEV